MKLDKADLLLLVGPAAMYALGYALNALVLGVNHSQMPVRFPGGGCGPADFFDGDLAHACMTAKTHLSFLADWITVVDHGKVESMSSPGDFIEMAGEQSLGPAFMMWLGKVIFGNKD